MIPRRPAQIFRSRWSALLWALGVILFAVMSAGFAPSGASPDEQEHAAGKPHKADIPGEPIDDDDIARLVNLTG